MRVLRAEVALDPSQPEDFAHLAAVNQGLPVRLNGQHLNVVGRGQGRGRTVLLVVEAAEGEGE